MEKVIIVGLGNPGLKYQLTRHNAGFLVADALAKKLQAQEFRLKKRYHALVTQLIIDHLSMIIAKPQTFMNLSGKAVAALLKNIIRTPVRAIHAVPLLIITDDLDLPFGAIRYRAQGGSGGHHGLQSIIEHLGTEEFSRLRIGIRPPEFARQPGKAEQFVLDKFTADEMRELKECIVPHAVQIILERIKSQCPMPNAQSNPKPQFPIFGH